MKFFEDKSIIDRQIATGTNPYKLRNSGLKEITDEDKQKLGIEGGIKVTGHISGPFAKCAQICPGFVITTVDQIPVYSFEDLSKATHNKAGVMLRGVYPDGYRDYYYLDLTDDRD